VRCRLVDIDYQLDLNECQHLIENYSHYHVGILINIKKEGFRGVYGAVLLLNFRHKKSP